MIGRGWRELRNDLVAKRHAAIADKDARSGDQPRDLVLGFPAKGAPKGESNASHRRPGYSPLTTLPWLAGSNRITVCPKLSCFIFSAGAGEGVDTRTELYVNEPSASDHRIPSCARQGTGNSTGPEIDVAERALRNRLLDTHVGNHHPATWPKDPGDLATDTELVRAEVEHPVADHHVGPAIVDR